MTADCNITNGGGTLIFKPISWSERQICHPSVRSVPLATTQHLDPDTYLIEVRTIDFTIRLTDDEKVTLMDIFNDNTQISLQLYNEKQVGYWNYTGWLEKPQMTFEYKVENGANIRWWKVQLSVLVDLFTGPTPSGGEQIIDGGFELDTGWVDFYTENPVYGSTDYAHTGVKSLFLYSNYIKQAIPMNIPYSSILSFGFWFLAPVGNTDPSYIIFYTDNTDSGFTVLTSPDPYNWYYYDILSSVDPTKSVKFIAFHGGSGSPTYVDDVSLITSIIGLSDITADVNLGAGILDPIGIYLGFITDFERVEEKNVQVSNWLNQLTTTQINYPFFNNRLVRLNYTFRASDEDKWYVDQLFLLHTLISLTDAINDIANVNTIFINEINVRWTSDNWLRPWIMTISLLTETIT